MTGAPDPADPLENNKITITQPTPGTFVVTDTGAALTAGLKCTQTNANTATCSSGAVKHPISHIDVSGGGGDDVLTNNTNVPSELNGGFGNDTLNGGSGNDILIGGGGRDIANGNAGDDLIYSLGRGSDYVRSKSLNQLSCGDGTDGVYATSTDTVNADCEKVVRGVQPPANQDVPPAQGTPGGTPTGGTTGTTGGTTPVTTGGTTPVTQPTTTRSASGLRIASARVLRRALRLSGSMARGSSARALRVTLSAKIGKRTVRTTRTISASSAGRYALVWRLGPRMQRARRVTVTVTYAGNSQTQPQTVRRTVMVHR